VDRAIALASIGEHQNEPALFREAISVADRIVSVKSLKYGQSVELDDSI